MTTSGSARQRPIATRRWITSLIVAVAAAAGVYWVLGSPTVAELATFAVSFVVIFAAVDYLVRRAR